MQIKSENFIVDSIFLSLFMSTKHWVKSIWINPPKAVYYDVC